MNANCSIHVDFQAAVLANMPGLSFSLHAGNASCAQRGTSPACTCCALFSCNPGAALCLTCLTGQSKPVSLNADISESMVCLCCNQLRWSSMSLKMRSHLSATLLTVRLYHAQRQRHQVRDLTGQAPLVTWLPTRMAQVPSTLLQPSLWQSASSQAGHLCSASRCV